MKIYRRFLFTRSEIRGIFGLSVSIIFLRLLIYSFPLVTADLPPPVSPADKPVPDGQFSAGRDNSEGSRQPGKVVNEPKSQTEGKPLARKKAQPISIEINSADSISLLALTGIGPSFARRIIKFREMLGGYATLEQLLQVYGMDSARYSGFIPEIRLDTSLLRRIDLNRAEFREMLKHPYLEYEHVKAICNFRERKGSINSPDDLWSAGILPDSLQKKLYPYLKTK